MKTENQKNLAVDLAPASALFHESFSLVRLVDYTKQPLGDAWNAPESAARSIDDNATGYGLPLAANNLCSIDPDNIELARVGMKALGFDLDYIMNQGVRTISTRNGSGGRSTFAAEGDISWLKFGSKETGTILELRASSPNLQDCVPGLLYKDKAGNLCTQKYANGKSFIDARDTPLPDDLYTFWEKCSTDIDFLHHAQGKFYAAIEKHIGREIGGNKSISTGKSGGVLAFPAPGIRSKFNEQNRVEDLLTATGKYWLDPKTRRWTHEGSEGAPGIRPIPGCDDLWQSDHGSDPLNGTFDAWIVNVIYNHGGDVKKAIAAWELSQRRAEHQQSNESAADGGCEAPGATAGERHYRESSGGLQYVLADDIGTGEEVFEDELVERIINRNTMSVIYGDSNSGKTFLAVELSACLARGIPFLGQRTERGMVVYLATEGFGSVRKRLKAYKLKHGVSTLDVVVVRSPVNLYDGEADATLIIDLVRQVEKDRGQKCVMVVGDTMARIASGANENAGQDMTIVMANADRIIHHCRVHFLWIHHCGKDAARGMRGWSGIRAAIDTEIEVVEGADKERSVEITKQRDGEGKGDRYGFTLDAVQIGTNKWGVPVTSCVVRSIDAPDKPKANRKGSGYVDQMILEFFEKRKSAAKRQDVIRYVGDAELARGIEADKAKSPNYIHNRIKHLVAIKELMESDGIIQPTAWKP